MYALPFGQLGVFLSVRERDDMHFGDSQLMWRTFVPFPTQIRSTLSAQRLGRQVRDVLQKRHSVLSARYTSADTPQQVFDRPLAGALELVEADEEQWPALIDDLAFETNFVPFSGPLWHLAVLRSRDGVAALALFISKLIADKWAFDALGSEISAIMQDQSLPEAMGSHAYAEVEARWWSKRRERTLHHWRHVASRAAQRTSTVERGPTYHASSSRPLNARNSGRGTPTLGATTALYAYYRCASDEGEMFLPCCVIGNRTSGGRVVITSMIQPGVPVLDRFSIDREPALLDLQNAYLRAVGAAHFDPLEVQALLPSGVSSVGGGFPQTFNLAITSTGTSRNRHLPTKVRRWNSPVPHWYSNYLRVTVNDQEVRATWSRVGRPADLCKWWSYYSTTLES